MLKIKNIFETEEVAKNLKIKGLIKQYIKSKSYIISGVFGKIDFKIRQPKEKGVWSFRINKQFRAFARLDKNDLIVYLIDNHQN